MGDEYTETVDTSSDMDTSEDFSEDVSADSNDIADDIPEDVPEDSSFDSDDMADDIPEDIPEDAPEDSSADSEDIADDIPEDIPEDAPADTQNDAANEISSDETEDTTSDVSTDEQPAAIQNDMADEAPSDETEDTASDVSADEQPTDSQDDMADEVPSDETEDTASDISADERPTDTQNDMERNADTQEDAFLQLSDYMNEHNYGPDDFATYSQDPEWQQLHSNAYPDYVLPEDSSKGSDIANEAPAHPNEDTAFNISADTQDNINGKIPMAETEDTVLDTQGDMDSDVSTSETEDMVPDAYDDQTYDDMDNESPTMEDGANDTNWNPFKPKKETKNAYNWNKNEWEATPVVRDMPPKGNTDSKEYSSMVDALEKANVEYRPIQLAEQGRTEQDIINRLSGGDMTKGSCSSLALAYAGNKAGYDVLDFRDGDSRSFFSSRNSIQTVADMPGVNSTVLQGTNDIATANQLLSGIQAGKEYYLATGGHAAIVRRDGNGYQYLELQHPSNGNGWHNLNDYMLRQRFGCKDSRPYECSSYLMDVDSLANSSEFRNLLGYINTASSSQKKGIYGNVR